MADQFIEDRKILEAARESARVNETDFTVKHRVNMRKLVPLEKPKGQTIESGVQQTSSIQAPKVEETKQ